MTTYRDPTPWEFEVIRQQLAIAESLRETEVELSAKRRPSDDRDAMLAPWRAWSDMWNQLDQVRDAAARWGRDVAAYDDARSRRKLETVDPWLGVVLAREAREAAEDAVDALRLVFPEIVVPGKPRAPRPARPMRETSDPSTGSLGVVKRIEPVAPGNDPHQIYTVSLRSSGPTYASAQFSTHPVGRFSNKCICCNAETPYKLEYRPLSAPNLSVDMIRAPRCHDCVDHVRVPTSRGGEELLVLGVALAILSIALGFVREPWMAIPGIVGVLALVGLCVHAVRSRRRIRRIEESLFRTGHYARFSVIVRPNELTLRTSNPHLRNDFLTLNTR